MNVVLSTEKQSTTQCAHGTLLPSVLKKMTYTYTFSLEGKSKNMVTEMVSVVRSSEAEHQDRRKADWSCTSLFFYYIRFTMDVKHLSNKLRSMSYLTVLQVYVFNAKRKSRLL